MEFAPTEGRGIKLAGGLVGPLGVQVFSSPSVFNFFLPTYQPPGPVQAAGLVAPASELGSMPLIVQATNGFRDLVRSGLRRVTNPKYTSDHGGFGDSNIASGFLSYSAEAAADANSTLDELSLLLTGGRLSPPHRKVVQQVYEQVSGRDGRDWP